MKKLLSVLVLSSICSLSIAEYDLAVRNVTVIDAASDRRTNQTVYISGDKIARVDSSESTMAANQEVDGRGKFLIPGLWDMHVHIVYDDALTERMPELFLNYGITSVRDTGALLDKIMPEVKRWQTLGDQAPDLFFSGPLLDGNLVVYNGDGRPEIGVSNPSVESARASVKSLVEAGAHFIKIYELVSPEVFGALVAAAAKENLPIAAHVPLSMRADTAGPRVGSMEHLRNVEIACAEDASELHEKRGHIIQNPQQRSGYELRSHLHSTQRPIALETADPQSERCQKVIAALHNTIQVPTIRLNTIQEFSPVRRSDWEENLPSEVKEDWLETAHRYAGSPTELGLKMSTWSMSLVDAMNKSAVPIGAGTDTPIAQAIPGYSLHTELERLVDAGLSSKQALAAATIRPAEFFSLDDRKGRIEPGMEADLVLLEKDPLADIRHTRSIVSVIANGKLVR